MLRPARYESRQSYCGDNGELMSSTPVGQSGQLGACWLARGMNFVADFLKPRLTQSHTTVVTPFYKRVIFVRFFNCPEFSSRLSKICQALDAIAGIQFRIGSRGLGQAVAFWFGLRQQLLQRVTGSWDLQS